MTLSPREALAASLSPTEILARDKEGFPQKSSITFGEVVSTFSRCGSVASKRHGGIYISKSLKIPNCCSTISDNTLKLEPNFRDIGDSLRFSPRSSIRTAPLARSRTPSPCSSRRPRSLPVTPRSSTAQSQRYREPRRDFHERLKDAYAPLPGGPLEMEAGTAFRPSLPEPGAATSSFNRGNPGGTASAAVTPGGGSCHAEAIEIAKKVVEGVKVGKSADSKASIGPLASQAQWERVQGYIQTGIKEGANLVAGGPGRPEGLEEGFFVKPTIFADVDNKMTIAQEEIFGPVLSIIPYNSEEEAIRIANDTVYGLNNAVGSASPERAMQVARKLRSGMVMINDTTVLPDAPFGGYKQSGNAREWGTMGIEEYLVTKTMAGKPKSNL